MYQQSLELKAIKMRGFPFLPVSCLQLK